MDAVLLSRIQFAMTIGFHFIFAPMTIGLSFFNLIVVTKYALSKEEFYARMARFWTKLLAITFAVGAATGIAMEFQFGTNWSTYSRFVGDIFGAPLAAEGIFAFFLESAFLGVLLSWDRVSIRVRWVSALLVTFGSWMSAFWILVANSWQQTPAGYHIVNGRAELTSFAAAIFNPSTLPRFAHTLAGAVITGAFFVMGVSAWFMLRRRDLNFARWSFRTALFLAFVVSVLQILAGHLHGVQVAHTQPEKLAAIEAVFDTQRYAPITIFGVPDIKGERMLYAVRFPSLLSWLSFGHTSAPVKGLKEFPRSDWPPISVTFYTFHLMVIIGFYFVGITGLGLFLLGRRMLYDTRLYLWIVMLSTPLPYLANELGWITAEVGRQPWIVYHLLRTSDGISVVVPASHIQLSIIAFVIIDALIFSGWIFLLRRTIRLGPDGQTHLSEGVTE